MSSRIKIVSLGGQVLVGDVAGHLGEWVKRYDPEAYDGQGDVETTSDPAQALVFPSHREAWDCWRQVPRNRPVRPDGKPNRPLTAFTVTIEKVE